MDDQPFAGLRVYYSGSIAGSPEPDPALPLKLVRYMQEKGAHVASEHVAIADRQEMEVVRAKNTGIPVEVIATFSVEARKEHVYTFDLKWVDEATHIVALVNAKGSYGVGAELEHAIVKPKLGLNYTPVLCLVRHELYEQLSSMVGGVPAWRHPDYHVLPYTNEEHAKQIIHNFLTGKIPPRQTV